MKVEIRATADGQELWIDGHWRVTNPTLLDGNTVAHVMALQCTRDGFPVSYELVLQRESLIGVPGEGLCLGCPPGEGPAHTDEAADMALARAAAAREFCFDCPPVNYPTDATRCAPCPRRKVAK